MDFNKIKNFCSSKIPLRKRKACYYWQKIFAILQIYLVKNQYPERFSQLNYKINNPVNMYKNLNNKHYTKKLHEWPIKE